MAFPLLEGPRIMCADMSNSNFAFNYSLAHVDDWLHLCYPQILIYKSNQLNSRRKTERIKLAEFVPGGCQKQSEVQYTVGIMVPAVPPTDMSSSSVCRVKYELQVIINLTNWSKFISTELSPIVTDHGRCKLLSQFTGTDHSHHYR